MMTHQIPEPSQPFSQPSPDDGPIRSRPYDDLQAESREWQAIAEATRALSADVPPPSLALLEGVWAQLDAEATQTQAPVAMPSRANTALAAGGWRFFIAQARVIHRGVWLGSALSIVILALFAALTQGVIGMRALAVFIPLIAAAGAAFVYGREADPALELALAAPVSPRALLLSRVALVLGFDLTLGVGATWLAAALHGQSVGGALALWLGPAALLSMGALLLSLLLGPVVAAFSALSFWLAQIIALDHALGVHLALDLFWQTNPLTLLVAMALLLIAVAYTPSQERWAE